MKKDRKLKIAVVQMKSKQGDTKTNLIRAIGFIEEAANNGADIVCLPELFYSGYHLESEEFQYVAEPIDGYMSTKLKQVATENNVYIIAGYAESTDIPGRLFNSAIFIDNNGNTIGNMRKVNAWGQEKLKFREGNEFPVYDTPLGKIGIMICYDVEFPEPSRIMALKGAEIVFVPAVWSIPAEDRWHIDLAGNALFNLFFMVGANPVGDGSCGCSKVVHPSGRVLAQASNEEEEILYCHINMNDTIKERSRLPYLNDFKEDTFSMDAINKY